MVQTTDRTFSGRFFVAECLLCMTPLQDVRCVNRYWDSSFESRSTGVYIYNAWGRIRPRTRTALKNRKPNDSRSVPVSVPVYPVGLVQERRSDRLAACATLDNHTTKSSRMVSCDKSKGELRPRSMGTKHHEHLLFAPTNSSG